MREPTPPDRRRWFLALLAIVALTGSCTSHSAHSTEPSTGSSMPSQTEPATAYLAQAKQLITDIAASVAPHATLRTPVGDRGPLDCTAPLKGLQYYSIDREFDAPTGQTGASLIPAIADALKKHGYQTVQDEVAGKAEVRAGTTRVGISVTGLHDGPTIHFGIDTQCGTPTSSTGS